jgi:HEAT repeat protein
MSDWGMPSRSIWGLTPRQSIELKCARRGEADVVACCIELLAGRDVDDELVFAIGGPAARSILDGGQQYWLRVWAMRALLYAWEDTAGPAVLTGLADQSWRVREMAAKVTARRQIGEAFAGVAELRNDPVARVRAAAAHALIILTAAQA